MSALACGYVIYLACSVVITVGVGYTLHRHGRIFLIDVFQGNIPVADVVNHLLLIGFCLVNLAFVLLLLRSRAVLITPLSMATIVSHKLGIVLTTLGVMHFVNVGVLAAVRWRIRHAPQRVMTFLD